MNSLDDIWSVVLEQLSRKLTPTTIKAWFADCRPVEIEDSRLVISTKSDFKRDIIKDRYSEIVKEILSDLFSSKFDLLVLTEEELADYVSPKSADNDLPEMEGYTFDRFIVGKSNEFAHAAALAVAEKPGKNYNPLFIYGNSGLGKTHLLWAIGHSIREHFPEKKISYIKGDDFTNELIKAIKEGKTEDFRNKHRHADLLLFDDIQFIAGKQSTQEEFFHTFNYIYEAGHQIVITSDRPPMEMSLLDDRLRTRFEGGLMADIAPPDLETRMAIARNKAARLGLLLPDSVIEYIATAVKSNVRQLEGVIKRLTAYQDILNDTITKEAVDRAIVDITVINDIPTPELIIRETANYYNLSPEDLKGVSRSREKTLGRQIAMYLMRQLTNLSLNDIGKELGRNHTTALSSIRRIEELMASDQAITIVIRDITSNITSSTG